jgi:hypothetical protein
MPDKDNQVCTVLLIFALGVLIYYLSKSKPHHSKKHNSKKHNSKKRHSKKRHSKKHNSKNEPSRLQHYKLESFGEHDSEHPEHFGEHDSEHPEHFANEPVQLVSTGPVITSTPMTVPVASQQTKPTSITVPSKYLNNKKQPATQAKPQQPPSKPAVPINHIDSVDFNELDEAGADLAVAFKMPLGDKPNTGDMVDLNKNNLLKYDSDDFLPKEINNDWFDTDFSQAKYNINDDKLINTERYIIGINTVGQSLKNASYDIRGTIPNPKFTVSPWNNSTYEADMNLKPLC